MSKLRKFLLAPKSKLHTISIVTTTTNTTGTIYWRAYWLLAVIIAFLLATTPWMDLETARHFLSADDTISYLKIANHAPRIQDMPIPFHHAQRFFPHYFVGSLHYYFGLSLETTYRACVFVTSCLIIQIFVKILTTLGISRQQVLVFTSALLCTPYCFRYYWIVPTMWADLIFVVGLLHVIYGLITGRIVWLVASCFFAALGRQTTLLILPGLILWIATSATWQQFKWHRRMSALFVAVLVTLTTYKLSSWMAYHRGSAKPMGIDVFYSLLNWFFRDEFNWPELAEHTVRVMIPYAFPLALLIIGVRPWKQRIPKEALALILMVLGICAMPFFVEPPLQVQNQSRQSAYGVALGLIACAYYVKSSNLHNPTNKYYWMTLILIVLGSIHHLFSQPAHFTAIHFAASYIVIAILMGITYRKYLAQA